MISLHLITFVCIVRFSSRSLAVNVIITNILASNDKVVADKILGISWRWKRKSTLSFYKHCATSSENLRVFAVDQEKETYLEAIFLLIVCKIYSSFPYLNAARYFGRVFCEGWAWCGVVGRLKVKVNSRVIGESVGLGQKLLAVWNSMSLIAILFALFGASYGSLLGEKSVLKPESDQQDDASSTDIDIDLDLPDGATLIKLHGTFMVIAWLGTTSMGILISRWADISHVIDTSHRTTFHLASTIVAGTSNERGWIVRFLAQKLGSS